MSLAYQECHGAPGMPNAVRSSVCWEQKLSGVGMSGTVGFKHSQYRFSSFMGMTEWFLLKI